MFKMTYPSRNLDEVFDYFEMLDNTTYMDATGYLFQAEAAFEVDGMDCVPCISDTGALRVLPLDEIDYPLIAVNVEVTVRHPS